MRRCPHHKFAKELLLDFFYEGIFADDRKTISQFIGNAEKTATPTQLLELYGEAARDNRKWEKNKRGARHLQRGVHRVDDYTALSSQVENLTLVVNQVKGQLSGEESCEVEVPKCFQVEQADYAGRPSNQQYNPYNQTYNLG